MKQRIQQQILVFAKPETRFAHVAFPSETKIADELDGRHVIGVRQRFNPVQGHAFKAPIQNGRQGFGHEAFAPSEGAKLVAKNAALPATVPFEKTTGAKELTVCFSLDCPPCSRTCPLLYAHQGIGIHRSGQDSFEERYRERVVRQLQKRAEKLGLRLTPVENPD